MKDGKAKTEAKAQRKSQKIRKTPSGDWIYCSFSAHPEEVAAWKLIAKSGERSLSGWLRNLANAAVAAEQREREAFHHENPKPKHEDSAVRMENVSTDRT